MKSAAWLLVTMVSFVFGGCATISTPEVPYEDQAGYKNWEGGIESWRLAHPEYAEYIIKAGFGGPSLNEQDAKRAAMQHATQQFGYRSEQSWIELLEYRTLQKVKGQSYYYLADVYMGFDRRRVDARLALAEELAKLQHRYDEYKGRRTMFSAFGWPTLVLGVLSGVAAGVAYFQGNEKYKQYDATKTTPDAVSLRHETQMLNAIFLATAGVGGGGVSVGTVLLLLRPDIRELEQQIKVLKSILEIVMVEGKR